jgi:uncharacterized protein YbaA (DUF1428 family)
MSQYTDGFVIPVPEAKLEAYREMATKARDIWLEYGALDYKECVLDDNKTEMCLPFPQGIGAKAGETVVFAWIVYESREHRDAVNAKVMADPRLKEMCPAAGAEPPFDVTRMLYGGFTVIVGS